MMLIDTIYICVLQSVVLPIRIYHFKSEVFHLTGDISRMYFTFSKNFALCCPNSTLIGNTENSHMQPGYIVVEY